MFEINHNEVLKKNLPILADYYVMQYGEQYRDLITDRLNKIVFCIYRTSSYPSYIKLQYEYIVIKLGIQYLNELGINAYLDENLKIVADGYENIDKFLSKTFLTFHLKKLYTRILIDLSLLKKEDFTEEDIAFIEEFTKMKIDDVLSISNKYMQIVINMNGDENCREIDRQYYGFHQDVQTNPMKYIDNDFNTDDYKLKGKIIDQFSEDYAYSFFGMELKKDGTFDSVVYYSPYNTLFGNEDIILDHEIRHAIESEIINEREYKSGLSISNLSFRRIEKPHKTNGHFNEIMTQKMSLESTRRRYNDGIYIYSNKDFINVTTSTGYDKYIPLFDEIVDEKLYKELVDARINYEHFKDIEKTISEKNAEFESKSKKIN